MGSWTPPPVMKLDQPDPPVYHSPFDSRAKLMNLQNLALQQQEGQQNLQVGQLNIQDRQRALARQQAVDAAFKNAYTVDENGRPQLDEGRLTKELSTAGYGSAVQPIMEGVTKYNKSRADLDETRGKAQELIQNVAGSFAAAVQAANNDPHLYLNLMKHSQDAGVADPAHVKALTDDVNAALASDPTGEAARRLVKQHTDQMIAGSPKQRELATQRITADATAVRDKAQATLADISSLEKGMGMAAQSMPVPAPAAPGAPPALPTQEEWDAWRNGVTDPRVKDKIPPKVSATSIAMVNRMALTREQQQQADQAKATLAEQTRRDTANMGNSETELAVIATNPNETPERRQAASAALKRLDQSKIASRPVTTNVISGVPTAPATGAAAELHGEEFLKTLPPAFAARIRQLAAGEPGVPTGRAATSGAGLQIMNALYQYDPEYSQLLAQQRKENLHQFNDTHPGSAGGQLLSLNTMIHHADLYLDSVAALKNGTFKPGNEIYNKVATIFGAAPPTNAALLAQFFASETGKVATGGVPAEGEINKILAKMSTDGSPEAMEGAGKTLLGIAGGRMQPLKQRRDDAHLEKFVRILDPESQAILQRRGFDPETMKPVQGGGAPPLPASLSQSDVGKTYLSPKTGKRLKITAVDPKNPKQFQSQEVP